MHLLEVRDLCTQFSTEKGAVPAVSNVNFNIRHGQVVAIVGESGSGKSVTAQSIMRLISHPGKIVSGEARFNSEDLLKKSPKEMRNIRGKHISMIFQEPMSSLNPVFTCGDQVQEVLRLHRQMSRKAARKHAIELFQMVGIPDPERRVNEYPDQLSGGMRQRVMIAIALACEPQLLIADEPTTALDVTIQAQILELLKSLQQKLGMSILLITHDFGVVAEMADEVIVMYAGKIIEQGPVDDIMNQPRHPYTQGLLQSIPSLDGGGKQAKERLYSIEGTVPNLLNLPVGCSFYSRCDQAKDKCRKEMPVLSETPDHRKVSCWLYGGEGRHE